MGVVLEACEDLSHPVWQEVESVQLTDGMASLQDLTGSGLPARTYRLRMR